MDMTEALATVVPISTRDTGLYVGAHELELGPFLPSHSWPLSGSSTPDSPLASTFGPRGGGAPGQPYTFHRGIDIEAPLGTPVHAIADGEVQIAGFDWTYGLQLVQLCHRKPGFLARQDRLHYYYSNYMHLSSIVVHAGDVVHEGDLLGYTGLSRTGAEHLHFEIRDGGKHARHCIHPLAVLPYERVRSPSVGLRSIDMVDPFNMNINMLVTLPAMQADLVSVDVAVYHVSGGAAVLIERKRCDFHAWNRGFSPIGEPDVLIHAPTLNGVRLNPRPFSSSSVLYGLDVSFINMVGATSLEHLAIEASARTVGGASCRERLI